MKRFGFALCLLFASLIAGNSFAAARLEPLTIGYSNFTGTYAPLWIAVEDHLGAKHGLDLLGHGAQSLVCVMLGVSPEGVRYRSVRPCVSRSKAVSTSSANWNRFRSVSEIIPCFTSASKFSTSFQNEVP